MQFQDIAAAFGSAAPAYDTARRRLIPCIEPFYEAVLANLPFAGSQPVDVLDLGAGTGLLAALVRSAFTRAALTLIDISPDMLDAARKRFAGRGWPARFIDADYVTAPLDGPYDAVVSALSIHHLEHDGKRCLFERCFAALKPGGTFINADQVLGDTPAVERKFHEDWLAECRETGASDEEMTAALQRMIFDRPATLREQMGWLEEIGYRSVSCCFQHGRFATIKAIKPA